VLMPPLLWEVGRNARGLPRLRLAMTGKGDNDKARKQCVTNHMNEYEELTERPGMIYAFQRREGIVAGRLGGSPKRSSTTERIQASYSVLI